jgi:hypothetical protein
MENKVMAFAIIAVLFVTLGAAPPADAIVALVPAAAVAICMGLMGAITIGAAVDSKNQREQEMALQDQGQIQNEAQVAVEEPFDDETKQLVAMERDNSR